MEEDTAKQDVYKRQVKARGYLPAISRSQFNYPKSWRCGFRCVYQGNTCLLYTSTLSGTSTGQITVANSSVTVAATNMTFVEGTDTIGEDRDVYKRQS